MIFAGAAAAVWLGLLWYAAPLAGGDEREPADRVAGMLVLGTLTALVLGFVHLLYGAALLVAVVVLAGVRRLRAVRAEPRAPSLQNRIASAIVVFATVAVAWPALVRPLLEGDSLSYHLPNAAAWVQSGSIWDATTRYWWYPGGSELFAAALAAVAGPFSLGLCGTLATLLLGLRIVAWARRCDVAPSLGAMVAAATIATLTVALQAGNLQNDVWLAAFFLELLYDARFAREKLAGDASVCALVKPYGWLFALYGVIAAGRFGRAMLLPAAVAGAWVVRDVVLWPHATIPPGSIAFPALFSTTVAGNGAAAIAEFARELLREGPWLAVLAVAPLIGLVALKDRRLALAGVAALVAFAFMPFSYRNAMAQLAGGYSLRYALPALAVGAVAATLLFRRAAPVAIALLAVSAVVGLHAVAAIFWIDPYTHDALGAALAVALAVLLRGPLGGAVVCAVAAMLIVGANVSAERHAVARYDELFGAAHSHFFDWLAATRPARLVVSDIPAGAVFIVSPTTKAYDVLDPVPCDQARSLAADLAFARIPPAEKTVFPSAVRQFAHCGPVLYEDAAVRVVRPARATE